jgi:hypothetical protein
MGILLAKPVLGPGGELNVEVLMTCCGQARLQGRGGEEARGYFIFFGNFTNEGPNLIYFTLRPCSDLIHPRRKN